MTPTLRQAYEDHQREWLIPQAITDAAPAQRRCDEPPHPYRTAFQRDRDRVTHCSAFRRLDFKTQVFMPHVHDHFRTRLTHTLEVAQVGRALGRALQLNEDLIEAVALAHDLGHPPFGHCGEAVLDELMADHGGFEHNRQSLRIVDYLEHPYPAFRGLNLTRAVRECLAKHETRYDHPVSDEVDTSLSAPLEGQLVDLADEIAYTSADLDDALASGWITGDDLAELALWERAIAIAEADAPDARDIHKRIRACKAVMAIMVDAVVGETPAKIIAARVATPDDVRRADKLITLTDDLRRDVDQLQCFLMDRVYTHPDNRRHQIASQELLRGLFDHLVSHPDALPSRYARRIDTDGLHRVVCDYISGMTDRFCREHAAQLGL
jgi:dGTPase